MFCGKCGTKVNENDKYCMNCGNKVVSEIEIPTTNTDVYVSKYAPIQQESYFNLIISILAIILSIIPLNIIYMAIDFAAFALVRCCYIRR